MKRRVTKNAYIIQYQGCVQKNWMLQFCLATLAIHSFSFLPHLQPKKQMCIPIIQYWVTFVAQMFKKPKKMYNFFLKYYHFLILSFCRRKWYGWTNPNNVSDFRIFYLWIWLVSHPPWQQDHRTMDSSCRHDSSAGWPSLFRTSGQYSIPPFSGQKWPYRQWSFVGLCVTVAPGNLFTFYRWNIYFLYRMHL